MSRFSFTATVDRVAAPHAHGDTPGVNNTPEALAKKRRATTPGPMK
jgi:hypothetical protein